MQNCHRTLTIQPAACCRKHEHRSAREVRAAHAVTDDEAENPEHALPKLAPEVKKVLLYRPAKVVATFQVPAGGDAEALQGSAPPPCSAGPRVRQGTSEILLLPVVPVV